MTPSIILGDDGNVRLLVGGSGGTKIITSVALVRKTDKKVTNTTEILDDD